MQEAWLSFQYEKALSNLLVWMQPQLFSFVTDSLLFVLHSRHPIFFLTLPKIDVDFGGLVSQKRCDDQHMCFH